MVSLDNLKRYGTIVINIKTRFDDDRFTTIFNVSNRWQLQDYQVGNIWDVYKEDTVYYLKNRKVYFGNLRNVRGHRIFNLSDIKEFNEPILEYNIGDIVTISNNWKWGEQNLNSKKEFTIGTVIEDEDFTYTDECVVKWSNPEQYICNYGTSILDYQLVHYAYAENETNKIKDPFIDPLELIQTFDSLIND